MAVGRWDNGERRESPPTPCLFRLADGTGTLVGVSHQQTIEELRQQVLMALLYLV